jgi:type III pantothenate kinase
MILTIDIGNTNIVIGLFENNKLIHKCRMISDSKKNTDDYAVDMVEFFLTEKIDCLKISGAIIASVVPTLTGRIEEAIKKITTGKVLLVGENGVNLNIEVKVRNKSEVGADRLVNSIFANHKFGNSLIIIDFGTATTFDIVGKDGDYLGGIIAPGINLSLKALHDMTAKLPKINIKPQSNVIGKSTIEAMNSGVYFGYIALVDGLIKKIEEELGYKTTRIITGGLSEIFKNACKDFIDHHEADLTLEGLHLIYTKTI